MANLVWRNNLVGGTDNDLDNVIGMTSTDAAIVVNAGALRVYIYDGGDIQGESLPNVVKPLVGAGSWLIAGASYPDTQRLSDGAGPGLDYVTDAEKVAIGNLSGTNSGDQDLSAYALEEPTILRGPTLENTPIGSTIPAAAVFTTLRVKVLRETVNTVVSTVLDLVTAAYFKRSVTGNVEYSLANIPSSEVVSSFILELSNGGSFTVTWFAGVVWEGNAPPVLSPSGLDILGFYTTDGGVTWVGMLIAKGVF